MHDIGHPPYSHLLESCISANDIGLPHDVDAWHEANGLEIIKTCLPANLATTDPLEQTLLKAVARLASKEQLPKALVATKKLVDAVIDVDRMDFVARDGRTSGSEFGTYDIDRLVQSFRVHAEPQAADGEAEPEPERLYIRPSDKALSAIESLLQERYKIYRWVHFHHRVMQSKALMRYALNGAKGRLDAKRLQPTYYVNETDPKVGYTLLGDAWVEHALDEQLLTLTAKSPRTQVEERQLTALLGLVFRRGLGIPLWKRTNGYSSGVSSFDSFLWNEFSSMTEGLKLQTGAQRYGNLANWIGEAFCSPAARPFLDEITRMLNREAGEWFLIEAPKFSPGGEERLIVHGRPQRVEFMTEVSSIAAGLEASRRRDVHLYVFRFPHPKPEEDAAEILRDARMKVARVFATAYKSVPGFRDVLESTLDPPKPKEPKKPSSPSKPPIRPVT